MGRKMLQQLSEKEWYFGEMSGDEKTQNGIGLKRERDGSLYYGLWKNGLREGFGTLCEPDGKLLAGTWENDKSANIILIVYPIGGAQAIFCGKLEKGKPKDGILLCSDGKIYHGIFSEWNKYNFDGEGALLWPDKRIYAGRWKNGGTDIGGIIRRADGRMTGTLSNVRMGYVAKSWQETEKHFFYGITDDEEGRNSNGILFYADGEFFAGELKGGQRTGFGVYRNPDEKIYIGEWYNGIMSGQGMCIRWSPDFVHFYVGEFKNNLYDGEGCSLCRTRGEWDFLYSGFWKGGKKSGEGILNLNEGKVYVGKFSEDQRNGVGETIGSDGSRNVMNWKMGIPDILLEQVSGPGPLRNQYGKKEIISRAVLNSLKDGDEFGEEQYFVGIRADANAPYQRTMQIEPGCDYEIRIFYHNDADGKAVNEEGTAKETRLKVFFTQVVRPGENGVVSASITSSGSSIPIIWDGITIQSSEELNVNYKIASAKLYNSWQREGRVLPQTLFTKEGVYLGTDELNGILPPGSSGYITFVAHTSGKKGEKSMSFVPKAASVANSHVQEQSADEIWNRTGLKESKKKRRHSRISIGITASTGNSEFEKLVSADIGEEINVKIFFTNNACDRDITISVSLPSVVELVNGSSVLKLSDGSSCKQSDNWINDGLMLSNFYAEGEGEIQFRLRYFPNTTSSSGSAKIESMIETTDIIMHSALQIIER